MKYLVTGRQGCGIPQVIEELENLGASIGHIFRSTNSLKPETYSLSRISYSHSDIEKMEVTNAYIFMQESYQREKFIEGLSFWDYDNHDIIYMSVDQVSKIPERIWNNMDITLIWLDNSTDNRISRLKQNSKHNISLIEENEKPYIQGFIDRVYDKPYLYFFNEEPERVATIIWSLVKYPDLSDIYIKNFN